jgi:dienelactone hydrolase
MHLFSRVVSAMFAGLLVSASAFAQSETAKELAFLTRGASALADLRFPSEAKELSFFSSLNNAIFKPSGPASAPLPALILAHTCGGIRVPESKYWLEAALKDGYVVLVIDSLRGNPTNCLSPSPVPYGRLLKDLYDGAAHLAQLPIVDPRKIAVLGFSQGAFSAAAVASPGVKAAVAPGAPRFAASAALYGTCEWPVGTFRNIDYPIRFVFPDSDKPLLLLMGSDDTETPPAFCGSVLPQLKASGAPVEWSTYDHTTHCWDCSTLNGLKKTGVTGAPVVYRYDPGVTEDSRRRVFAFLRQQMGP